MVTSTTARNYHWRLVKCRDNQWDQPLSSMTVAAPWHTPSPILQQHINNILSNPTNQNSKW